MSDDEKDKIVKEPQNENLLSYEILMENNKKLEARIASLEKTLADTNKVIKNNLTTTFHNEPKESDAEAHERLRKKLYSSLKIKTN